MQKFTRRRLEARAFSWSELTQTQKEAVEHVAELMLDALNSVDAVNGSAAEIATSERRSQLAFIDGDRGSGKTSVLLTVRDLVSPALNYETAGLPASLRQVSDNHQRFQLLEPLDMEPIRRHTNLFAAILARVELLCSQDPLDGRLPLSIALEDSDARDRVLGALQSLQNDTVLGWEGALPDRGGRIDPHAYAAEVMQSEKAGLGLNRKVEEVLDKLALLIARSTRKLPPIFVLPVDDFDLAPNRCLELLRLIRAVTTARLFFLIAGSSRLAEKALKLQCEGEMAMLIPSEAPAAVWHSRITPVGMEVAVNNLRKLLPPEQRAVLSQVHLDEALRFRVDPHDAGSTLRSAMETVTFERSSAPPDSGPTTLFRFFLLDDHLMTSGYSAARWLAGTPRQVQDIALLLARRGGVLQNFGEEFLIAWSGALARSVKEEWRLDVEDRDRIASAFDTSLSVRIRMAETFKVEPSFQFQKPLPFDHGTIEFRTWRDFAWTLQGDETAVKVLPDLLIHGATALHDLATSLWGGYLHGGLLLGRSLEPSLQGYRSSIESPYWVNARWELSDRQVLVPWWLPSWPLFRDYERFSAHWEAHLARCGGSRGDHARAWLAAILEVVLEEDSKPGKQGRSLKRLRSLLTKLAAEDPVREMRRELRLSALVAAGLLCTPESVALETDDAAQLLEPGKPFYNALEDTVVSSRIREERATVFALTLDKEILGEARAMLQAAITPELAESTARERLATIYSQLIDPVILGLDQKGGFEDLDLAVLQDLVASTSPTQQPQYVQSILEYARVALTRPHVHHACNTAHNGLLVPSAAETREHRPKDR